MRSFSWFWFPKRLAAFGGRLEEVPDILEDPQADVQHGDKYLSQGHADIAHAQTQAQSWSVREEPCRVFSCARFSRAFWTWARGERSFERGGYRRIGS